MKILFGSGYYFPDSYGGTETYIHLLAKELQFHGHECAVVTSGTESHPADHIYEGIPVFRIGQNTFSHREITGKEKPHNLQGFQDLVRNWQPDVFHLHSLTTALNEQHLEAARELGIKTVFTGHIPGIVCARGDLLYMGKKVCDGIIRERKCLECYLDQKGISPLGQKVLSLTSKALRRTPARSFLPPSLLLIPKKQHSLSVLGSSTHAVIAASDWLGEMMKKNGIPASKVRIVRQGVNIPETQPGKKIQPPEDRVLVGFIGRIDPLKGLDKLITAFKKANAANLFLEIVGSASPEHYKYELNLQDQSREMENINWLGAKNGQEKWDWYRRLHFLCIPSQCLETGPIVALEALACQVPVIGSNLGSIPYWVEDGKTGLLFPYNDMAALAAILKRIAEERNLAEKMKQHIRLPRSHKEVASEMLEIYSNCL